jgi:DNA-binding MarR family transcriptional regulator
VSDRRTRAGRAELSLFFDLFAAGAAMRNLLAPVMAGTPLSAEQYAVYSVLLVGGPMSLTAVADQCHMPLTTAAGHVRSMEERGHLARTRDSHDKRAWALQLSAEGKAAHEEARRAFGAAVREVRRRLELPEDDVRRALQALETACREATTPD